MFEVIIARCEHREYWLTLAEPKAISRVANNCSIMRMTQVDMAGPSPVAIRIAPT